MWKTFLNYIENSFSSNIVKIFSYWFIFSSIYVFSDYFQSFTFAKGNCWAWFESCKNIIPLTPLPFGYSQALVYTLFFSLLIYAAYALYNKKYLHTYLILLIVLVWKYVILIFSGEIGNYNYYDIVMQTVFFISINKVWSMRVAFLVLYFLSSTIKIHEGWILGTYFTSLITGLPFFSGDWSIIATNIVIVSQIVAILIYFTKQKTLIFLASWSMLFFHLYSTILVGYRYPITSASLVIILFFIKDNTEENNLFLPIKKVFNFKNIVFIFFLIVLFYLQFISVFIKGDTKLTLEGNFYGLYMFEANHQCVSQVYDKKGDLLLKDFSYDARNRCDPKRYLQAIKKDFCSLENKEKFGGISWTFDHSINGSPFYRIVDEKSSCDLSYKPFSHNIWIKTEFDNPEIIFLSRQNLYSVDYGNDFIIKNGALSSTLLQDFPINKLSNLQEKINVYKNYIIEFYWFLWTLILISCIILIIKEYIKNDK